MTAHRLLAPRWLATGGAVLLAGVLGTALLLQNSGSACAAPPSSAKHQGKATFYDLGGTQGNCSTKPPADDLYVALGKGEYSGAAACGSYLDVTGPKGKVRVKVFDSCPECAAGHLDLSRTAFKKIRAEVAGVIPITYRTVAKPSVPGPLAVRIKEGASRYWFAALIDNHGSRLTSVKVSSGGGSFRTASRTDYNYWLIDSGAGPGPYKIKITDGYGRSATLSGITMSPGRTQRTSVSLSGGTVSVPKKTEAARKASPKPSSAKPSASSAAATTAPTTEAAVADPVAAPTTEPAVDLAAGAPASCG